MPSRKAGLWAARFEVSGTETLRPTPDILDALKKDYPLEASIADLVDNSIDAKATKVLVRFERRGNALSALSVIDNGIGMDAVTIRRAMQFAARRSYRSTDLGMFGVGLKTASLSQASTLTVFSRAARRPAVGRQWTNAGIKKNDWTLNHISARSIEPFLSRKWDFVGRLGTGTIVRWDDVADFQRLHSGVDPYVERAIERLQHHLGLTLHRFLDKGIVKIHIDVEDADSESVGPPSEVLPLNPFPPEGTGSLKGYPKMFTMRIDARRELHLRAHIWPKKSKSPGYRLGGGRVAEHQGFYFFRHGRLIQDGGWSGLIGTSEPHLSLARVEVDIPDTLADYLEVRSNKAGIDVPATFAPLVMNAKAPDGTTFRDYIAKAEDVYRARSEQKAKPLLAPGDGVPAAVRDAIKRSSVPIQRDHPMELEWSSIRGSNLFEIDQQERRVSLNRRYRKLLLRGANAGATDAPLLRTLLYFLLESIVDGSRVSAPERQRLDAMQAALIAALKLESKWADR